MGRQRSYAYLSEGGRASGPPSRSRSIRGDARGEMQASESRGRASFRTPQLSFEWFDTLALPFGASASVLSFNRVARALQAVLCHYLDLGPPLGRLSPREAPLIMTL